MSRPVVAMMIAVTIALGAASRVWPIGSSLWDKSFGDVAYAIMVAFVVLFVSPRAKPIAIGAIAVTICFALELFQLTGVPARAPPLLRIVLGTTFAWHDVVCYAVGAAVAAVVVRGFRAAASP